MKRFQKIHLRSSLAIVAALLFPTDQNSLAEVLDDFNDNKVKGWEKFDFGSGNGYLREKNGQLTIGMHQAPKQPFFVAATYGAETFKIEDGTTLTFSIDLIETNQINAFAVMSFMPKDTPVSKLTGYSAVKDGSDFLLAKGLNKFFYDLTEGDWVDKKTNVRLEMSMTGSGKSVEITSRIFDLDDDLAMLCEKTVTDTPKEEDFSTGKDKPSASFIDRAGKFVLLLYHNDANGSLPASWVTLDNARYTISGVFQENQPPVISEVSPQTSSLFVDPATKISFVANDDKGALLDGISVTLNGTLHTASSGLTIEGPENARKLSLGGLQANRSYHAEIKVFDAEGESDTRYLFFDTFDKDSFVVEIEDYNFDGGDFIPKPVIIPELDEDGDLNWDENASVLRVTRTLITPTKTKFRRK